MADLVTHLCSALLPGALLAGPRPLWLALGAVAPDALSRVPGLTLDAFRRLGAPIPPHVESPLGVFHMPVGIVLGVLVVLPFIHPSQRASAGRWLVAGGALHLAVDVLQDHHGHGYFLLFPLSTSRWELGWIGSEATIHWAGPLALLTLVVWVGRWAWHRRASAPGVRPPEG